LDKENIHSEQLLIYALYLIKRKVTINNKVVVRRTKFSHDAECILARNVKDEGASSKQGVSCQPP
jgi:hypothetical protein